ncbi:hypothetical protein M0813_24825 [Anaeramoeba flamelloides]|uniref:Uncharacterized protein n=1 Tax=Anaeramoeba flamelloides TaxID=1746091 RepID=A0ABQ8Y5L8_9EUKA|nr:hypothetical protein M0813_24825 [Anaeramoeba flamelloides]
MSFKKHITETECYVESKSYDTVTKTYSTVNCSGTPTTNYISDFYVTYSTEKETFEDVKSCSFGKECYTSDGQRVNGGSGPCTVTECEYMTRTYTECRKLSSYSKSEFYEAREIHIEYPCWYSKENNALSTLFNPVASWLWTLFLWIPGMICVLVGSVGMYNTREFHVRSKPDDPYVIKTHKSEIKPPNPIIVPKPLTYSGSSGSSGSSDSSSSSSSKSQNKYKTNPDFNPNYQGPLDNNINMQMDIDMGMINSMGVNNNTGMDNNIGTSNNIGMGNNTGADNNMGMNNPNLTNNLFDYNYNTAKDEKL